LPAEKTFDCAIGGALFGAQQNSPGGRIVRTIGIARAKAKIGLQNLAYNIRRLVTLERMAVA
jgi:IS5 family transposase